MIKYAQTLTFNLAGAGVNVGDNTMTLKSFSDIDGNVLSMSDFGTKGFGTMEPGVTGQEESIVWTGVTANSDGTYTLTGVSHKSSISPYTETSGFNIQHNGGTPFVVSNTAGFYDTLTNKNNDEAIVGAWTVPTPISSALSQIASVEYVNNTAVSGAPDASTTVKGLTKLSVAPASPTNPIAVGINDTILPTQDQRNAMETITVPPSASNKFLTQNELNVTSGVVSAYAGNTAPSGYLLCNGAAVSRTTYANLFAVCSTTYGSGDGSTTFNVPNLQGRVVVMKDGTSNFLNLGQTGGELTHTLTIPEMPSHNHGVPLVATTTGIPNPVINISNSGNFTNVNTTNTGGDGAHNNIQPYMVLQYIIKT